MRTLNGDADHSFRLTGSHRIELPVRVEGATKRRTYM
jgi:hypothetical protein